MITRRSNRHLPPKLLPGLAWRSASFMRTTMRSINQQLVKIIQDKTGRPDAILVEPVGTPMPQVAKAAGGAGIGWGILNREADSIWGLWREAGGPGFVGSPDAGGEGRLWGEPIGATTN